MGRILHRIDDPELRAMLEGHKGGQLARAVAAEIDSLHSILASQGPSRAPTMMTDDEAAGLEAWMFQHFAISGRTPQPGERLVSRVMMTLHGLVQQVQGYQRALATQPPNVTPVA